MHDSREIRSYGRVSRDRTFTASEVRHFRHGYYASISFMDAQIGEILNALEMTGQAKDTIVAFVSDHGFHIGEQSLWGKTTNFELDARVPFIIADPAHPAGHGKTTTALTELVDLYPTLASLAGIDSDLNQRLEGGGCASRLESPDIGQGRCIHTAPTPVLWFGEELEILGLFNPHGSLALH